MLFFVKNSISKFYKNFIKIHKIKNKKLIFNKFFNLI